MTKVMIIGSGGRESALAWKLINEDIDVFAYPGNPGIFVTGKYADISGHFDSIKDFALDRNIDLVVIGPEQYLADGLTDYLREHNIDVFGPSSQAARIETDKSYAKELMQRKNVPTADYTVVESRDQFDNEIEERDYPYVVKVSGLAGGKGAYIIKSSEDQERAVKEIFKEKRFRDAAGRIIIEEFMEGTEASLFVITDSVNAVPMLPAQDYKRALDNDRGLNTGGMGSYAPCDFVDKQVRNRIMNTIIKPVLDGLKEDGSPFRGLLYCGLMITGEGPKVVEFNARFGDPETQSILPLMKDNLYPLLKQAAAGTLDIESISFATGAAVTVIIASKGYPGQYRKGEEIKIDYGALDENIEIFQAGTMLENNKLIASGGRIIGITATGKELNEAVESVYGNIAKITINNSFYRKDIGKRALR
ncbi:MAG: phosphoribosylamine--glycine ligase [candidate division WOR-3 bacterium]|nr:phosphoribosylamine--glycine ligase [candidate division WOR-3 bacterium]